MTRLLPRRTILRGAGSALALPLLDAMLPLSRRGLSRAQAQATGVPRRIVFLYTGNGYHMPDWECDPSDSAGRQFELSPLLKPLEGVRDQCLFIEGVPILSSSKSPAVGHPAGCQSVLTGACCGQGNEYGGGEDIKVGMSNYDSLDAILADKVGGQSRFAAYRSAVYLASRTTERVWVKNRTALSVVENPSQVYNDFFSTFSAPAAGAGPSPAASAVAARRHRMLDASLGEINKLNGKLDAQSKQRLDEFAASMRDVEQRLDLVASGQSCSKPAQPPSIDTNAVSKIPEVTDLQMDLLSMAIACDLTRVFCFQINNGGFDPRRPLTYSFLNGNHRTDHHNYSHQRENDPLVRLFEISTFHNQKIARLVSKLRSLPEGDGTVLDNTAIFHFSEVGTPYTHSRRDIKWTIYGGGKHFNLGRYLKVSGEGINHNRLLLSMMRFMGVNDTTIGFPEYCGGGPLAGLTK